MEFLVYLFGGSALERGLMEKFEIENEIASLIIMQLDDGPPELHAKRNVNRDAWRIHCFVDQHFVGMRRKSSGCATDT